MNIAKQREIMALKNEAEELNRSYTAMKEDALNQQTHRLLDAAFSELMDFLTQEGFTATENHHGIITAASEDGIIISIDKKPRIFSVSMPNYERYSVSITSTLEAVPLLQPKASDSQDDQIWTYKQTIESLQTQMNSIDNAEYSYVLSKEPRDGVYTGRESVAYPDFSAILREMFS